MIQAATIAIWIIIIIISKTKPRTTSIGLYRLSMYPKQIDKTLIKSVMPQGICKRPQTTHHLLTHTTRLDWRSQTEAVSSVGPQYLERGSKIQMLIKLLKRKSIIRVHMHIYSSNSNSSSKKWALEDPLNLVMLTMTEADLSDQLKCSSQILRTGVNNLRQRVMISSTAQIIGNNCHLLKDIKWILR